MKKCIVSVVFAVLIGAVLVAQAKPVVVVAPFDTKGVAQDEAEVITELFTAEYANTGSASVVDRNSFDKIKTQLSFQSSDWSNADKVAQLGKALNANHVVVGQLLQFKGQIITTIKIIDVNTTTILASYTEKVKDIEALLDDIHYICKTLSNKVAGEPIKEYKIGDEGEGGGIVFYVSPEGFDVYDGKGGITRCHYLEMSKTSLGESKWSESKYVVMKDSGVGSGKINTYKIVDMMIREGYTPSVKNCAAYRCMQYKTATSKAGEWFLPNNTEAELIIATQSKRLKAEVVSGAYWTSSAKKDASLVNEFKKDPSWKWTFYRGGLFNADSVGFTMFDYYDTSYPVRAVRAF